MERRFGGVVSFDVPAEVAFDYLADPRNRAEWQSSLRRVEEVVGEPGTGQTWTDVTWPGLRPAMRTDTYDRPAVWSESGTWRSVRADLTLRFTDETSDRDTSRDTSRGAACEVGYRFRVQVLGPLGVAITTLAMPAVGADLRRAARILSSRQ